MAEVKSEGIVVKRQNFDEAMQSIKVYANRAKGTKAIDKVSTNGGFLGLGSHKVTGEEFNSRMTQIGEHLIDLRNFDIGTLDIVTNIYKALDALDKEHISGILIAANSAKAASDKATDNVKAIEKIIEVLQKFKESLEKKEHLMDVDKAWGILEDHKDAIKTLSEYKEKISALKHLNDIDKLWTENKTHSEFIFNVKETLKTIHKALDKHSDEISDITKTLDELSKNQREFLEEYSKKISEQKNLIDETLKANKAEIQKELDSLNKLFSENQNRLDNKFSTLADEQKESFLAMQQKQNEALSRMQDIQNEKLDEIAKEHQAALSKLSEEQNTKLDLINSEIQLEKDALNNQSLILTKKMKIAYIVAGSSITLSIIHIILNILGVI